MKQIDIHDVEEAMDGAAALDKLRARSFGIVISDWHMQPMDGIELLRHMRQDPVLGRIPFIMVSAASAAPDIAAAEQAGVSGYVVKPFDAETLKRQIRTACGRA